MLFGTGLLVPIGTELYIRRRGGAVNLIRSLPDRVSLTIEEFTYVIAIGAGNIVGSVTLGVVGVLLIGVLPDAVLRPWLAQETGRLPAAMYFVGATGGRLSLGAIGWSPGRSSSPCRSNSWR